MQNQTKITDMYAHKSNELHEELKRSEDKLSKDLVTQKATEQSLYNKEDLRFLVNSLMQYQNERDKKVSKRLHRLS